MSTLGPVLDLSKGGMMILTRRIPPDEVEVGVTSQEASVTLAARVAWSRKLGFRRHEVGLEFQDVDEETARALTDISSRHAATQRHVA